MGQSSSSVLFSTPYRCPVRLDAYPQHYDCSHPLDWHGVPLDYHQYHEVLEIQPHPLSVFLILYLLTYLLYLEPYLLSFVSYIYQFPLLSTSAIHYYDVCLTEVRTTFILSSLTYYLRYDYSYCVLNR